MEIIKVDVAIRTLLNYVHLPIVERKLEQFFNCTDELRKVYEITFREYSNTGDIVKDLYTPYRNAWLQFNLKDRHSLDPESVNDLIDFAKMFPCMFGPL